jgi:hypothetical protein
MLQTKHLSIDDYPTHYLFNDYQQQHVLADNSNHISTFLAMALIMRKVLNDYRQVGNRPALPRGTRISFRDRTRTVRTIEQCENFSEEFTAWATPRLAQQHFSDLVYNDTFSTQDEVNKVPFMMREDIRGKRARANGAAPAPAPAPPAPRSDGSGPAPHSSDNDDERNRRRTEYKRDAGYHNLLQRNGVDDIDTVRQIQRSQVRNPVMISRIQSMEEFDNRPERYVMHLHHKRRPNDPREYKRPALTRETLKRVIVELLTERERLPGGIRTTTKEKKATADQYFDNIWFNLYHSPHIVSIPLEFHYYPGHVTFIDNTMQGLRMVQNFTERLQDEPNYNTDYRRYEMYCFFTIRGQPNLYDRTLLNRLPDILKSISCAVGDIYHFFSNRYRLLKLCRHNVDFRKTIYSNELQLFKKLHTSVDIEKVFKFINHQDRQALRDYVQHSLLDRFTPIDQIIAQVDTLDIKVLTDGMNRIKNQFAGNDRPESIQTCRPFPNCRYGCLQSKSNCQHCKFPKVRIHKSCNQCRPCFGKARDYYLVKLDDICHEFEEYVEHSTFDNNAIVHDPEAQGPPGPPGPPPPGPPPPGPPGPPGQGPPPPGQGPPPPGPPGQGPPPPGPPGPPGPGVPSWNIKDSFHIRFGSELKYYREGTGVVSQVYGKRPFDPATLIKFYGLDDNYLSMRTNGTNRLIFTFPPEYNERTFDQDAQEFVMNAVHYAISPNDPPCLEFTIRHLTIVAKSIIQSLGNQIDSISHLCKLLLQLNTIHMDENKNINNLVVASIMNTISTTSDHFKMQTIKYIQDNLMNPNNIIPATDPIDIQLLKAVQGNLHPRLVDLEFSTINQANRNSLRYKISIHLLQQKILYPTTNVQDLAINFARFINNSYQNQLVDTTVWTQEVDQAIMGYTPCFTTLGLLKEFKLEVRRYTGITNDADPLLTLINYAGPIQLDIDLSTQPM